MVIPVHTCCATNARISTRFSIIHCAYCGSQLTCDRDCDKCEFTVQCVGLELLPWQVIDELYET